MNYGMTRMDNLFNGLFRDVLGETAQSFGPNLDVTETEDAFLVEVELPGISSENVQLQVRDDVLNITGTRNIEREIRDDNAKTIIRERRSGSFSRSLRLGPSMDAENISAKLTDGVLNVTIPKREPPKKIDIVVE